MIKISRERESEMKPDLLWGRDPSHLTLNIIHNINNWTSNKNWSHNNELKLGITIALSKHLYSERTMAAHQVRLNIIKVKCVYNAGAQYQIGELCEKICHLLQLSTNNNTFVALIHIDCLQPLTPTSCMLMGTVASPADTYTYIMAGQEILFSQVNGMLLRLVSINQWSLEKWEKKHCIVIFS